MNGPSAAEIIDTFMARATRVITPELVNAAIAEIEDGYSFTIRLLKGGGIEIHREARDENALKARALELRPFLPWVDDVTKIGRVINAVMQSLTDDTWRRSLVEIQRECKKILNDDMFYSYWSIPDDGWQKSFTDMQLAQALINERWFHEGIDPRMREVLDSEYQTPANLEAVSRLLNNTVVSAALVRRFITEARDAAVLNP